MKLLLKLSIVIVLVASGFVLWKENLTDGNPISPVTKDIDQAVANQESTKTSTKTELDAIFTYLPFLGFQFEDVVSVEGSDLHAVAGKRFVYDTNVLEVYQLENSSSASALLAQVKETKKVSRTINGKTNEYVAVTLNRYLCVIVEINDPVSLLEAYEFAQKTMKNLGMKYE